MCVCVCVCVCTVALSMYSFIALESFTVHDRCTISQCDRTRLVAQSHAHTRSTSLVPAQQSRASEYPLMGRMNAISSNQCIH